MKTKKSTPAPMLWDVHFTSSWYDNDPRAPGYVPVDHHVYVIAYTYEDAIDKAGPSLENLKESYKEHKVTANVVSIKNLVVARDCSQDGRLGFHSTQRLAPIELSLEEDRNNYTLAVCLVFR